MLFARISFVPNNDHEEAELVSAAENFLSALYRNGQIVGDCVTGWYDGVFDAVVYASHRDALHPRYHSRWVKAALVEIHASFGGDPICEVIDDNVSVPVPTLKSAASLFLYCDSVSRTSPVRHGNRGTPIAVPLLPIRDELRDEICDWTTAWCSHDRLFFGGGPLEIPAYHQLADPFSELMSEGRRLAAEIEQAVGVMVYSYVLRHWGLPEGETSRVCPGCGQSWLAAGSPFPSREPFQRFHFRCDACRLVSHAAATGEDEELARIGEFAPAKTISPRPAPAGPELARSRNSESVGDEREAGKTASSGQTVPREDNLAPGSCSGTESASPLSSTDLPPPSPLTSPLAVDPPESGLDNQGTSASADVVPDR